jgi:DNA polymerase-1
MATVQETLFSFEDTLKQKADIQKEFNNVMVTAQWDNLKDIMLKIMGSNIIAIDTETTGLDFSEDYVRLLQVKIDNDEVFIFDFFDYDDEQKRYIVNILLNYTNGILVFHNAIFDLSMLYPYAHIKRTDFKLFDTQVAEKIIDCGLNRKGFSLEDLCNKYLNIKLDKSEQTGNWLIKKLSIEQIRYAKKDVEVTYELYGILKNKLEQMGLTKAFNIDINCIPTIVRCIKDGIYLDFNDWELIAQQLQFEYDKLEDQILIMLDRHINLNSPIQLKEVLQDLNLGIKVETTGKDFLDTIKDRHPVLPLLIEYKTISKKLTSFGKEYQKYKSSKDNRLHPKYNLIGTATGRFSCNNPNIQQVPREKNYRKCFKAQEDGGVLIKADYSQIELRIATHLSQDPVMLKAYELGEDLHTLSASKLLGVPKEQVTKEQRYQAKSFNFGFLYSMGAESFKDYAKTNFGLEITLGKAEIFKKRFFETYRGLKDWHSKLSRKDYSVTLGGRIRRYDNYMLGELYNSPVQGTGADILKVALFNIFKTLLCSELRPVKIVAIVHDEIVLECKETDSEMISRELKNCMMEAWYQFIADVKIDVDITIGKSWGG